MNLACRNGCAEWIEGDTLPGERTLQGDPRKICHLFLGDLHVGIMPSAGGWTFASGSESHEVECVEA